MNLSKLLGLKLKDDEMLDVLEENGIEEVVYEFDRTHENMPDLYWAGAKKEGFLLRFNQHQICDAVFCYIEPSEGYNKINPELIGVTTYGSFASAEQECKRLNLSYSVAKPEMQRSWLRIDDGPFRRHFQFKGGALFRVTLSAHGRQ
ncbi:MAG: hypothetical protein QE272_06010 [Nevskia sp.]|nr:hypothetical protein [Nevskia sp.]